MAGLPGTKRSVANPGCPSAAVRAVVTVRKLPRNSIWL